MVVKKNNPHNSRLCRCGICRVLYV